MNRSPFPILVVDDDADLREALQGVLRDEGYVVATVATADQALEVLRAGAEPCVILLDIRMPGMDGLGFRREQLADPAVSKTPVVFFSADPTGEGEARRLGVEFYLKKPVDLLQLLEVVAHYCDDPDRLETVGCGGRVATGSRELLMGPGLTPVLPGGRRSPKRSVAGESGMQRLSPGSKPGQRPLN